MTATQTNKPAFDWREYKGYIFGGIAVLVFLSIIGVLIVKNGVVNERNTQEKGLNSMYLSAQNELSSCLDKSKQAANVTTAEADKLEDALSEAIKGRYEGETTAQSTPGALFSAIVEDYPELDTFDNAFSRAFTVIVGCRENYKNVQNQLLDKLQSYESWRTGSFTSRTFANAPSGNLEARIGNKKVTGQEALDQMFTIVLVQDAINAYETGVLDVDESFDTNGEEGGN
ncbi:hypothetical protein KC973_00750 [Candidatus Saccharibacteria bacterium]|nr:hypothetical protein [Candidatus Saccharibacteria bacterium]